MFGGRIRAAVAALAVLAGGLTMGVVGQPTTASAVCPADPWYTYVPKSATWGWQRTTVYDPNWTGGGPRGAHVRIGWSKSSTVTMYASVNFGASVKKAIVKVEAAARADLTYSRTQSTKVDKWWDIPADTAVRPAHYHRAIRARVTKHWYAGSGCKVRTQTGTVVIPHNSATKCDMLEFYPGQFFKTTCGGR